MAAVCYVVLNLLIKLPVLIGLFVWFQLLPPLEGAGSIPVVIVLAVFGLSLGALIAPISLVYFDIRYGLPFVLIVFLLITPVLYPLPDAGLLRTVADYNPIAHLVLATRDLLLIGTSEFLSRAALTAAATVLLLAPLSFFYYHRGMPRGVVHI